MKLWSPSLLLSFQGLLSICTASKDAFFRSAEYNRGDYGHYVSQSFKSSKVKAARPNMMKPFSACDDGSKLFVAPRGTAAKSAPMIFDASGEFIWTPDQKWGGKGNINHYNFQMQRYKGEDYIVFWAGNDAVKGHGAGHYYMFNNHYELYRRISAGNHLDADLHTFYITHDDTAIASVYETVAADLTSVDPAKNESTYIWDGLFQELDIATGEVLFQWRASEHVDFTESYIRVNAASDHDPWDFFHINMVEKDTAGNYLVSSRHTRSIIYVDGRTGDVLWHLGGKKNSFHDLSNGAATIFLGQHDAHWVDGPDGHKAITFFDNRADWQDKIDRSSRGTRVAIDLEKMTAKVDAHYTNPRAHILSISQGSYQTLPSGNVLIGYGYNGVMTEFDKNGTVLCDAWFMPQGRFGSGDVQSYRNLKYNWTGLPQTPPNMVFEGKHFYISWLGATEVRHWVLYDSFHEEGDFDVLLSFAKNGFETAFRLQPNQPIRQFVKAEALDEEGRRLGTTLTINMGNMTNVFESDMSEDELDGYEADTAELVEEIQDLQLLLVFGFFAIISGLFVLALSFGTTTNLPRRWQAAPQDEDDGYAKEADGDRSGLMGRMKAALPKISRLRGLVRFAKNDRAHREADESGETLLSRIDAGGEQQSDQG